MRRFNLAKSSAVGDAGKEAVGDTKVPPTRTRLLLLIGLLIVVAAFAARDMLGRFAGVMTPQAHQTAPPAPAPTVATPAPAPSPPTAVPGSSLEASSAPRSDKAGESAQPKDARSESGQGRFAVQVGAMAQQANALALLKRLEEAGYTSTIRKSGRATTQHVVLVVTPSGRAEADAALERLRAEGIPVRVSDSDGGYRIDAGRSIALDDAIDLARQLQERGFATKIDSETVGNALYLVRVGDFLSLAEARRTGQELREKGFPVLIVKK